LRVYYRVHKNCPHVPILSQIYPAPTIPSHSISLRFILILSTHLRLGLASCLFPSDFPSNTLYTFAFYFIRATCPAHLIICTFTSWRKREVKNARRRFFYKKCWKYFAQTV
jgi:hypothetical protein